MSTAAPTTIARIATVALLLFAAPLIAIPPAQAASGTTQLTIRLTLPEAPPDPAPLTANVDQETIDHVTHRLRSVLDTAPKYTIANKQTSRRDVVVWSHGTGWTLNGARSITMIEVPDGVVSL
jgi:acetyl esterase/lipase